ncbi:WD repeat-containing protein 78-like isoform X4 [Sander lucioperca]|uniref:WD repeat-containing protein 78-like isoform X4 n=1 Tax=Sander lucioperca TaxID=283035 RepID=UPI00125E43F1|nr:WD repeat-containing protein 78-like isoform X4 [Sander lucioperca]
MKKSSLVFNSSSRAMNTSVAGHQVSQSSRHKWNFAGSQTRRNSILVGGSNRKRNILDRNANQAPRKPVRVLDNDGNDVTPLPLYHAEPGDMPSKPGRFLDEIFSSSESDQLKSTSSFNMRSFGSFLGSSLPSSLSTTASMTKGTEDSVPKLDIPIIPPPPCGQRKRDNVKQHVTEEMLDDVVDVCLTETDTISLFDLPPLIFMSEDADDTKAIKERNLQYAELCKNRTGNDKYVERSMQTFSGAPKEKQIQTDKIVMVDEGSTIGSLLEMETCSLNAESNPELIMLTESFQHSLLVMERSIVANLFQPKLAAYRQLPIIKDPDSTVKPETEEKSEEGEESSSSPTLERLWAFSCELTRGWNITCMVWNKENPDLLAVAYGDCDSTNQKPSLICCWSLKNPTWPERVFHCHSCVTSLDFSANNPSQLAVGMYDGTIAIYTVQSRNNIHCIANSSECSKRHLKPVWQVNWSKQEITLSGEDRVEALVAVSADGRITKWLLCSNGLECIDLMKLKKTKNSKKKAVESKKKTEHMGSALTPGLCMDFHPTDSSVYLVGTWEGLIQKCSVANCHNVLETYQNHFCPVNSIEWSPFSPDVFLSCSSDWTIQLWKQECLTPVLSFTSAQRAVYAVRWSPNWSTIFAAINGLQVEIWDLNLSILHPTIVHQAAPGVTVTSVLFSRGTDCVLVGDSEGQVTVYQLKNLSVGQGKQVDSLEDIIGSAVSRYL